MTLTEILPVRGGAPVWAELPADLLKEWSELVERTGAEPFARPGWFAAWWRAFGEGRPEVLEVRREGRLVGVLPLARRRGCVRNLDNWHTFLCGPVAEDDDIAEELVERALRGTRFTVDLGHLSVEHAALVARVGARLGFTASDSRVQQSPYVPVTGTFEEFLAERSTKFVARIRQRRRKLSGSGELEFVVQSDFGPESDADLEATLAEAFRVESLGWKGAGGTAIVSDPRTADFYGDVARWAASEGMLHISTVRLSGRVIAVEIAIDDGRSHYGLKVGYDPEFRTAGPGFILAHDLIQSAFARGLESFEFMGSMSEEKRRWTEATRDIRKVRLHPPSVSGRCARLAIAGAAAGRKVGSAAATRVAKPAAARAATVAKTLVERVRPTSGPTEESSS